MATHIALAREPRVIERIIAGEALGTRIPGGGERADSRKRWLAVARRVKGQIHVDAGAANALTRRGKSLLAAGIVSLGGRFERGDTIAIVAPDGEEIARGLASLSCSELSSRSSASARMPPPPPSATPCPRRWSIATTCWCWCRDRSGGWSPGLEGEKVRRREAAA